MLQEIVNCVLDCVDLEMGGWEHFDVFSIPPTSSDSIKARFSLIKVGHSHPFLLAIRRIMAPGVK